mmetsp:Transcript_104940/g.303672  ORF Transcript_104940/g.303672 Transcript_104940/m.303672 type:complete len:133 (+) Transcript_104940:464-862(+)
MRSGSWNMNETFHVLCALLCPCQHQHPSNFSHRVKKQTSSSILEISIHDRHSSPSCCRFPSWPVCALIEKPDGYLLYLNFDCDLMKKIDYRNCTSAFGLVQFSWIGLVDASSLCCCPTNMTNSFETLMIPKS